MRWIKKCLSLCIFFFLIFAVFLIVRFWISPASGQLKLYFKQKFETKMETGNQERIWELAKQKNQQWIVISENSILSEDTIERKMPLEMFLIGAVAASMDASYEVEALKAQAIVIRTNIVKKSFEGNGTISGNEISIMQKDFPYQDLSSMKKKWGKQYEEYCEKLTKAVLDTGGIIMMQNEEAIAAPYHQMSAGRTRNGREGLGVKYAPVKSVPCNDNLSDVHFLQVKYLPLSSFEEPDHIERDDMGYITYVFIHNKRESGEYFRNKYNMASANMEWKQVGNKIMISAKGIGHGFGFDEFYGNCLAKKGNDAFSILSYFFENISFEKMNGIA